MAGLNMWRGQLYAISLGLLLGGSLPGCGTALLKSRLRAQEAPIKELRLGGAALHCHELASRVFTAYLVCPRQHAALGILETRGRLGFSCPDLRAKKCRQLVRQVQCAGAFAASSPSLR